MITTDYKLLIVEQIELADEHEEISLSSVVLPISLISIQLVLMAVCWCFLENRGVLFFGGESYCVMEKIWWICMSFQYWFMLCWGCNYILIAKLCSVFVSWYSRASLRLNRDDCHFLDFCLLFPNHVYLFLLYSIS